MNNVQSPRHDDAGIEQELAAKAVAPRVTPADIEGNIASEHYFTAMDGVYGAAGTPAVVAGTPVNSPLDLLTFCVLVLRNGFTVVGKSAPASPENFDVDMGRRIARADAVNGVWPLMGYALKQDLWRASLPQMVEDVTAAADYRDRMRAEHRRLNEDLGKLESFIDTSRFQELDAGERDRMRIQARHMRNYSTVLGERIAHLAP